jgi:Mn-dependent DtxR family transcriptional regulator
VKVTEIQKQVLNQYLLLGVDTLTKPRSSLERLQKKGLVTGKRREGWALTPKGIAYLKRLYSLE